MQVVLSHTTAFWFWRFFADKVDALRPASLPAGPRNGAPLSDEILRELEALGIFFSAKHPLHLLYAEQEQRPKRPDIQPHVHVGVLPPGAILRLTAHICIASPELCFTQLACTMTPERLALAGLELSAAYALAPGAGLPQRPPLTTPEKLATFANLVVGMHGRKTAQRMAKYAVGGAESPMEAKVALLLSLPMKYGGYGLPKPTLNPVLEPGDGARKLYRVESYRPDLFWADARVDVEYHGDPHEGEAARTRDAARQAALEADGIAVTVLTFPQVADPAAFDVVARTLATRLGCRLRVGVAGFEERRAHLREELELLQ